MEFNVPQFIDTEDKVIGPLTIKQFGWLGAGGGVLFLLWFSVRIPVFIVLAIVVVPLSFLLAFKKIHGRSVVSFLGYWIGYHLKPKLYLWKKK